MNAAAIAIEGLVKVYSGPPPVRAVDGIDLEVHEGETFGLLGPNGAGKTTTLRMLLGLIMPTDGHVELFGRDPIAKGARVLWGQLGVVDLKAAVRARSAGMTVVMDRCPAIEYRRLF
jgi:ABC-type multidrug transport system ATPase subunit